MFGKPSLMTRIAIGKGIGFVIGLAAFFILPLMLAEVSMMERLGFLFWYTTFGAIIGVYGVFNWHPILKLPLPWFVRAPIVGAWLNLVLTLLIYDRLGQAMLGFFGADGAFESPFWFVAEGAIVGFIIGFFATRFGGEGPEVAGK